MINFYENAFKTLNLLFLMIDEKGKVLFCNDYTKRFITHDNIFNSIVEIDQISFKESIEAAKERNIKHFLPVTLVLGDINSVKNKYEFKYTIKYDNDVFTVIGQHLLDLNDIELTEHLKLMNEFVDVNRKLQKAEYYLKLKRDELQQRLDEVEYYANYDALTDLFNRRRILEEFENSFQRAKRQEGHLSVILIDIDHFKEVNDSYGHLVGDKVLTEISALMRNRCRSYEKLGRYGGEEFLIVLPSVAMNEAIVLASSLCKIVKEYFVKLEDESEIGVTISAGLAQYQVGDDDIDVILKRADEALYNAKAAGRDRFRTKE